MDTDNSAVTSLFSGTVTKTCPNTTARKEHGSIHFISQLVSSFSCNFFVKAKSVISNVIDDDKVKSNHTSLLSELEIIVYPSNDVEREA